MRGLNFVGDFVFLTGSVGDFPFLVFFLMGKVGDSGFILDFLLAGGRVGGVLVGCGGGVLVGCGGGGGVVCEEVALVFFGFLFTLVVGGVVVEGNI